MDSFTSGISEGTTAQLASDPFALDKIKKSKKSDVDYVEYDAD